MDSQATTRTRIGVLPVFVAVLFTLAVPVIATTVPQVTPTAVRPQVTVAVSELQVSGSSGLMLTKEADVTPIDAGAEASFTIHVWNTGPDEAVDVRLHDDLPQGVIWDFEIVSGDATEADCSMASSQIEGEEPQMSIDCDFGTLGVTTMEGGIIVRVFGDTDDTDCGTLDNNASAMGSNLGEPLTATASILVRCPTLLIDKVASVEVITISGQANDPDATPSVVTWTLTYTLTDGPVTNAVITDEVPVGFEFLDAAHGGTESGGVITWTFSALTESGSVTFRTTVDPETISRTAPTVNVAIIDSDETAPDEGEDSVRVVVTPPPLGGTPPPTPSVPDTALGFDTSDEPLAVPLELVAAAFLIGSLGATLASMKARNRRL